MQEALVKAAGTMPIVGPNCYGFINMLDGALLWPDYWDSSAAPDLPTVLGIEQRQAPRNSFESGQMLFQKSR